MPPLHIVWILANNSDAPYFSWFAERARSEQNVRFTFIALYHEEPRMLKEMQQLGHKAFWLPFDPDRRSTSMAASFPKLIRLFRKIRPDVVHAHLFDDALPALAAARMAGVKTRVITKGDAAFHWYFAPKGVKYDRLNNRNATHILALSEESRKFILEKEEADPKKMCVIHHGIPPESAAQSEEAKHRLRKRFGVSTDHVVIGTVARLIEWKGYRHIIDAAALLVKDFPQLRFLFTGQGAQQEELLRMVKENKLEEHVQFTGWIDRADVPSLYGIMDIYLHAATMEPFGFVIAEAMMNGVPVVSTPTGAAGDAIRDGENGYLVSAAEPAALADGIRKMLAADRKKLGEAARKTAEEMFAFEKMWNAHMKLYRAATGRPI
jgi:glycosyltransferase involved in cell wall biosynthesis